MVVRPVTGWMPVPRYGDQDLALKFTCGHVRWVRSRGQAMRLWGQSAECATCDKVILVADVLDWSWFRH